MITGSTISTIRSFAAEPAVGGIGALGVNLKSLILQILTFVLVFWLLKKYALDKVIKTLEERRQTIDKGVELGQKMAEEKQRLDEEVEKVLHKAREQADQIIAAGRQEVTTMLKEAETADTKKADDMLADAKAHIDDEVAKARLQLEKETVSLVAEATEIVVGERIDPSKDRRIIERALQEAGRG